MPSVDAMHKWSKKGNKVIKQNMNRISPLLWPLLRWLVISNRSHLRLLPKNQQFQSVPTQWQFEFITAPPEKEYTFQKIVNDAS